MSTTWFPPGWILDVDNPGYGELAIYAPTQPLTEPAVVTKDWATTLYGPQLGDFLDAVTRQAIHTDDTRPGAHPLPAFLTPKVARGLLPRLQQAVLLAVAGGDRFDRTYPDRDDPPPRPLCVRCATGTLFTTESTHSTWCDQYGHRAYGVVTHSWEYAHELHERRLRRWESRRASESNR